MTVRGTLGLLAVFALLAGYLLVVTPPAAEPPAPVAPLLAGSTDQVGRVELVWPDRRLRATRTDGTWRLEDGGMLPDGTIDDLLSALHTLRPMETLALGSTTAADYGLGSTATALVLSAGGAPVLQLRVGDRNPAWTGVYVQRTGSDEVLLVGALLHWELEKLYATATR